MLYTPQAADAGMKSAQLSLAKCYDEGIGTPVDKVLAEKWYKQAK